MADGDPHSAAELCRFADNLLQQVHDNFQALSEKLTLRMEDMGEHIDDLEKHVNGLCEQAGVENATEELTVRISVCKGFCNPNPIALFTGYPVLLIILTYQYIRINPESQ